VRVSPYDGKAVPPNLVITGSTYVYRAEPPTNGSRIGRETAG